MRDTCVQTFNMLIDSFDRATTMAFIARAEFHSNALITNLCIFDPMSLSSAFEKKKKKR